MAKAEELLLAIFDAIDEGGDVIHRLDARQHAQHRLVGAAVQRAVQRAHAAAHRCVYVHPTAGQVPASEWEAHARSARPSPRVSVPEMTDAFRD